MLPNFLGKPGFFAASGRPDRMRESHIANVGGEGGIRTHGELAPTAVFKTAALNHSATSPQAPAIACGRADQSGRSGICAWPRLGAT